MKITLSYLNPKQYAAVQIAKDIIANSKTESEIEVKVKALSDEDTDLSKRVNAELEKFGYRIPVDS